MRLSLIRRRFTVRRLMVVVAIVGLLLWLVVMRTRSAAYQKIAFQFAQYPGHSSRMRHAWHVKTSDGRIINYHEDENFWLQHAWATRLANKYWKLSLRPWLSAGPDPPRPEPLAHPRAPADCPAELTLGSSYERLVRAELLVPCPGLSLVDDPLDLAPRTIRRSPSVPVPLDSAVLVPLDSSESLAHPGGRRDRPIWVALISARLSARISGPEPIHRGLRCEPRRLIAFERTRFSIGHHVSYRSALIRLCDRVGAIAIAESLASPGQEGRGPRNSPHRPPILRPGVTRPPGAGPSPSGRDLLKSPGVGAAGGWGSGRRSRWSREAPRPVRLAYLLPRFEQTADVASRSMELESLGRNRFSAAAM